jgi:farnesyl-diphosphate farnesyltransferase
MASPDHPINGFHYERRALNAVSRSFALTIPQLPEGLRDAVTNAYLICRMVDTIEDEKALNPEQKLTFFREFMDVLDGRAEPGRFAAAVIPFLNGSTPPEERDLISHAPLIMSDFFLLRPKQQDAIRRCAGIMIEGMYRYQAMQQDRGLAGMEDLEDYCYHVAGVVGEMLTELFCDYSPVIAKNRKPLLELGVSFGKGLQMTNILKDLWDDRKRDVCWLPRSLIRSQEGQDGKPAPDRLSADYERSLADITAHAMLHLENAVRYTLLIPRSETGIRKFCLWAIGMAVFTLRKVNRNLDYAGGSEVKISRRMLMAIILVTSATVRSNFLLEKLFMYSSGSALPVNAVHR